MLPRWDQELTKSESSFITDAISFYDGSSQSNSDSGGSTSTFLGHGPRSLFRSGSNVFSSGTAQLLPLCISNSLIVPFLSASCESEWFFFTKRILSFALSLFIFLILSARFNLASSDLTSSVNTAIPIFSSDAILNCLLSCLCTPRHFLILVSFLLLSL